MSRLTTLRYGLRQQALAAPIMDAPRFARHFETALQGMMNNYIN
jgi:predicted O-linked N-acetylglucosamine transferase (SPINDLY family)